MVNNVGLSPEESLLATTLHGADLLGRADDFGSLEVGKMADLCVLDERLSELPSNRYAQTKVCLTLVDGRIVHNTLSS